MTSYADLINYSLYSKKIEKLKNENCAIVSFTKIIEAIMEYETDIEIIKQYVLDNFFNISDDYKFVYLKPEIRMSIDEIFGFQAQIINFNEIEDETIEIISRKNIVLIMQKISKDINENGHVMAITQESKKINELLESGELKKTASCTVFFYSLK